MTIEHYRGYPGSKERRQVNHLPDGVDRRHYRGEQKGEVALAGLLFFPTALAVGTIAAA